MSVHSSTSSSESAAARRYVLHTILWCLFFLCLARVAFHWMLPDVDQRPDVANAAEFLQRAHDRDLRVIAFGSSRMRGAFDAQEWAALAGLRRDGVVNLGVGSGRYFDALYMLREAGGLPASTRLVLVEMSHWNFNINWRNPVTEKPEGLPPQVRRWATLDDRLSLDSISDRFRLTLEWVWPLYDRRPLGAWLDLLQNPPVRNPEPPPPLRHWDPRQHVALAVRHGFESRYIAGKHFHDPKLSGFAKRNLSELLELVHEADVEVVLLQIPIQDAYLDVVSRDPASRLFYDQASALARAHEGPRTTTLLWERAGDCGLSAEVFVDYGHMNRAGARAFTRRLFEEITTKIDPSGGASAVGPGED